jgi:hypothetical protein
MSAHVDCEHEAEISAGLISRRKIPFVSLLDRPKSLSPGGFLYSAGLT